MVQELKDAQLRIKRTNDQERIQTEASSAASKPVHLDPNGLVVPKKLKNPCMESRVCQDLHREIRWNAKA